MRLMDFTAEASLYRADEAYYAMGAAGLARGKEVLPAQTLPAFDGGFHCIQCRSPFGGYRCCGSCPAGTFLSCFHCECRPLPF
jgi:hypothetical protein